MNDKLSDIIFNGDEIIGYIYDVIPFLEEMITDMTNEFLEGKYEEDYYCDEIKELKRIIDILKDDDEDYKLIRIKEYSMGGYGITKLGEVY